MACGVSHHLAPLCPSLTCRGLSKNSLTSSIPTELGELTRLQYACARCRLHVQHPDRGAFASRPSQSPQGACSHLCAMFAASAAAVGCPVILPACRYLNSELGTQQLTGSIPTELGRLTSVSYLYVRCWLGLRMCTADDVLRPFPAAPANHAPPPHTCSRRPPLLFPWHALSAHVHAAAT